MTVLMATDGSRNSSAALASAGRILAAEEVDVICVAPDIQADSRQLRDKIKRRAQRFLDKAKSALVGAGLNARTMLESGSPAKTLLRTSLKYDVTVIGSHGRNGVDGAGGGLGPVASRLVEHSNGTVLVGREPRGDAGLRILVAVDGSEGSLRAIDKMIGMVNLSSADVTLIHVVETPWLHGGTEEDWVEIDSQDELAPADLENQLEREMEREGENVLDEARSRIPANVAVSTLIYRGLPADAILTEVDTGDYDVIVLGAGGGTAKDLKHQLLGSVSIKVAWNAPCSVLLVRPGGND